MSILNLFKPSLGELMGLIVLSAIGVSIAFMVVAMASGLESYAQYVAGFDPQANAALHEVITGNPGANAP